MGDEKEVLGGNIELVGFNQLEPAKIIVVKKIVGNYVKKIAEANSDFEKIELKLESSNEKKVELHTDLYIGGQIKNAKASENNLFFALDKVLSIVSE